MSTQVNFFKKYECIQIENGLRMQKPALDAVLRAIVC